jgi:heterodisulfide reductase subunit C
MGHPSVTPFGEWSEDELRVARAAAIADSATATRKRLDFVVENGRAVDRMLEIDKELRIRRQLLRARSDEQHDHDEFIREQSLGGKRYLER